MSVTHRAASLAAAVLLLTGAAALAASPALILPPAVPPHEASRLREVTERASVAGRVTGKTFVLRQGVFDYLIDHPEFATHLTRALDVGNYRVWRTSDGLWLDDGGGAIGRFDVVYAAAGTRVVYLRGAYKAGMLPAIKGRAVAVLEYHVEPAADGRSLISPTLTGFVRIDNVVVAALSRILKSAATAKAEKLARRVVGDFAETAEKIEENPARALDELRRRPGVPAGELEEFGRLLTLR